MRLLVSLLLALCALGCGLRPPANDSSPGGETLPAFGAASGVTRADSGLGSLHRIIPLDDLSGDAEILLGDPDQPGEPFVMRIRELPGTRIPVHSHPIDEHLTVVQGTFYFAVGEEWDPSALEEMKPGAYAFVPKGSMMFGYAPAGAVVQVHGIGPFHIHWRDGSTSLDDADAAGVFKYRKDEWVDSPRGRGRVRQGYASGAIVQYEIEGEAGALFMVDEHELSRY